MGQTPMTFECPVYRSADWRNRDHVRRHHQITVLPGRRKNPTTRPGFRATLVLREWSCSCGKTGWSSHVDLAVRAGENRYARLEDLRAPRPS